MPPKKDYMNTGRRVTLPKKAAVKQAPRRKEKPATRPAPTGRTGKFTGMNIPRNIVDPVAAALDAEDDGARALRPPLPPVRIEIPIAPPPPRRGRVEETVAVLEARGAAKKRKAEFSPINLKQYVEAHGHDPISNVVLALEAKQRKIAKERERATNIATAVNNAAVVLERQMRRYHENNDLGINEINAAFTAIPRTLLTTVVEENELIEEEPVSEVDIRGLTAYITDVFNRNRKVRADLEQKQAELASSTIKMAQIQAENDRLTSEFEAVRKARDSLQTQINERDPFEDRYKEADARLKQIQDEFRKNQEEKNQLQTQVLNLQEEVTSLRAANERGLNELKEKESAITVLNERIADIGNQANDLNRQHSSNNDTIARLQAEIESLNKAAQDQQNKYELELNEKLRLQGINETNQRKINEMQGSIQSLTDEREEMRRSYEAVSNRLKAAEKERDDAIAEFGFNSTEVRTLREMVDRIKQNVNEAKAETQRREAALNEQIRRTETQRDSLQTELAAEVQRTNELKERLAHFEQYGVSIQGFLDLNQRYDNLREDYAELEAMANQDSAELERLNNLIDQHVLLYAEEVRQMIENQLAALRGQMQTESDERVRQAVERVTAELQGRAAADEASVADLQNQLDEIKAGFRDIQPAVARALAQAGNQYQRQLEETRNHYQGIIDDLRAQLAARPEPVPEVPVRRDVAPGVQGIIRANPLAGPGQALDHHMEVENEEIRRGNNLGEVQIRRNQRVARVNIINQARANPGVNARRGRLESFNPEVHRRSYIGGGGAYLVGSAPDMNLLPNERIAHFWTKFYRKHLVLNF